MELFTHESRLLTDSHSLASDLARMRIDSHRSPGLFQQICLAFRCGLAYRLYSLASQIRAVKMRVEVRWATFVSILQLTRVSQIVMDEHRLALPTTPQNDVGPPLPHPGMQLKVVEFLGPHYYASS